MISQNYFHINNQTDRLSQLTADIPHSAVLSQEINSRKIAKQAYEKLGLSQKASKNIKRNSGRKNSKICKSSQIPQNTLMSEIGSQNLNIESISNEILEQICEQQASLASADKENFSIENLPVIQNVQEEKKAQTGIQSSSTINNFPGYPATANFSAEECHNTSFEENKSGKFRYSTPVLSNAKHSRKPSQDNDYSDRETVEESVSCFSEHHLGSQIKSTQDSMRVEDKRQYWSSNGKKDYDSEFEQDFTTIFSSNNTTPIKKQASEEFMALTETKTERERSIEEELANFNPEINPCAFDSDTINFLIKREVDYTPEPRYLDERQNEVNWSMRAILLDWMMEVSMEFGLKRETYYYAVNYLDRYLSAALDVQKMELQLVGVTALYMASKVEEIYPPRVASYAKSTDSAYTEQQILEMELKMLKALKWMLTPPSLNTWANWYMNQWDVFIERSSFAQGHPLVVANAEELIQFKQPNQKSYARFREMMQLIDCSLLDYQTLQYKPRMLVASIMYVLLGKYFKAFTSQQIFEEFPRNSRYLLDSKSAYNQLFGNFLSFSFGFELSDLLSSVQYVSTYVRLPISLELPKAVKMNKENILEGHFEEFLAYQTHHPYNLQYIKRRPRDNF